MGEERKLFCTGKNRQTASVLWNSLRSDYIRQTRRELPLVAAVCWWAPRPGAHTTDSQFLHIGMAVEWTIVSLARQLLLKLFPAYV
jgi:hypothetical protein